MLLPALAPMYFKPLENLNENEFAEKAKGMMRKRCAAHASFMAEMQSRSCSVFSKRNVLPPPTKQASAESTVLRGSGDACKDSHSNPIALKRALAFA